MGNYCAGLGSVAGCGVFAGCIRVLEASCCCTLKEGVGHPRSIKVPSGCGSDLCEQEHRQQS